MKLFQLYEHLMLNYQLMIMYRKLLLMYYVLDEFEVYLEQLPKGNLWNFNPKKRKRNFTCLSKVLFPRISSGSGGIDSIFDNNGCSSI